MTVSHLVSFQFLFSIFYIRHETFFYFFLTMSWKTPVFYIISIVFSFSKSVLICHSCSQNGCKTKKRPDIRTLFYIVSDYQLQILLEIFTIHTTSRAFRHKFYFRAIAYKSNWRYAMLVYCIHFEGKCNCFFENNDKGLYLKKSESPSLKIYLSENIKFNLLA